MEGRFFLGSLVFGGDGEFRDLLAAIGWGFAPRIIVPLVGGITAFVFVSGTNFSDPQQARQLAQMTTTGTVGMINHVVNAGTFIWAGWVWTHAVARVRNISTQNAAIVVGAVVVIQILVNVGLSILSASLL
ncbi:YIP1 family protein [Haloquadratum walsbyi]|uniref:YIP1 family protein n=1 Tax=Haloquadratum walsbyi TaxID=293091 RepID=UPI0026EC0FBB|nr:YIP1 family protein [Haloquadratum walsbyi]